LASVSAVGPAGDGPAKAASVGTEKNEVVHSCQDEQLWSKGSAQQNAVECWPEILANVVRGRRPVLFLDYDGTLAPIVKARKLFITAALKH
jgi:hypothetical protein